jgi:hypothetical protein
MNAVRSDAVGRTNSRPPFFMRFQGMGHLLSSSSVGTSNLLRAWQQGGVAAVEALVRKELAPAAAFAALTQALQDEERAQAD